MISFSPPNNTVLFHFTKGKTKIYKDKIICSRTHSKFPSHRSYLGLSDSKFLVLIFFSYHVGTAILQLDS